MIIYEGNKRYSIHDASEESGVSRDRIRELINSGSIDAEKLSNGAWTVTPAGLVALKRMENIPVTLVPGNIHFCSPEGMKTLEAVKRLSKSSGISVRALSVILLKRGLKDAKLKSDIEAYKKALENLGV